jgi:hypothetical protein
MRPGLTVSIIGHAALLGFGFIAFPDARPFEVEAIEALPVELIDIAEVTDLARGDEASEILPEEEPAPAPPVEAAQESPEPAEEPAEQPVEVARPPEARPEPPVVEPAPEPIPELAALPEPVPVLEPETPAETAPAQPPAEARMPRRRPDPPKVVEPPPDEPPKVAEQEEAQETEEKFNPDDIAALLNKQDPVGGGSPDPSTEPQTLGVEDGTVQAAMTQSEIAALQARLYQCWSPPIGVREADSLVVTVKITLLPDGSLASQPELMAVDEASSPLAQIAAEAAMRAVRECAPFGDILRPEKYLVWHEILFDFDPRFMLGG